MGAKNPEKPESTSLRDGKRALSRTAPNRVPDSDSVSPSWQLQTAKARFSEVFRRARTEGPQRITRQGKEGVIMISEEEYRQISGKSRQPKSLVEFFRQSPLVGVDLDLQRDQDSGRDIQL